MPVSRHLAVLSALALAIALAACTVPEPEIGPAPADPTAADPSTSDPAQQIIDAAIAAHGGARYRQAVIEFDFRGEHFRIRQEPDGGFTYERTYRDSAGRVHEVLATDDLDREVDGVRVPLEERDSLIASEAVNSVAYFALLPFRLNDPAVRKRYLGEATVEGEPYDKVEVTFMQEGGGRDWEDRFVYWIHRDRKTMDYLAYRYGEESDDTRFRQAVNPRVVNGIRFADYLNFAVDSLGLDVAGYDRLFEAGEVELYSEVNLENVRVEG